MNATGRYFFIFFIDEKCDALDINFFLLEIPTTAGERGLYLHLFGKSNSELNRLYYMRVYKAKSEQWSSELSTYSMEEAFCSPQR